MPWLLWPICCVELTRRAPRASPPSPTEQRGADEEGDGAHLPGARDRPLAVRAVSLAASFAPQRIAAAVEDAAAPLAVRLDDGIVGVELLQAAHDVGGGHVAERGAVEQPAPETEPVRVDVDHVVQVDAALVVRGGGGVSVGGAAQLRVVELPRRAQPVAAGVVEPRERVHRAVHAGAVAAEDGAVEEEVEVEGLLDELGLVAARHLEVRAAAAAHLLGAEGERVAHVLAEPLDRGERHRRVARVAAQCGVRLRKVRERRRRSDEVVLRLEHLGPPGLGRAGVGREPLAQVEARGERPVGERARVQRAGLELREAGLAVAVVRLAARGEADERLVALLVEADEVGPVGVGQAADLRVDEEQDRLELEDPQRVPRELLRPAARRVDAHHALRLPRHPPRRHARPAVLIHALGAVKRRELRDEVLVREEVVLAVRGAPARLAVGGARVLHQPQRAHDARPLAVAQRR